MRRTCNALTGVRFLVSALNNLIGLYTCGRIAVGRHSAKPTISVRNKLILSFSVAGLVAAIAAPSMAHASTITGFSTITRDECAQALTWPDRTDEQKAFLQLCVEALTPPTVTPSPTVTITPSVTPSVTVAPTTLPVTTPPPTPTGTPQPTSTPGPTPSPSGGYTKPQDVGVPSSVVRTDGGPCTISNSNVTYNAKNFNCNDGVTIYGQNVTIKNSYITTGRWWSVKIVNGPVTIEDTTIGGPNACSRDASISGSNVTIRRIQLTTGGDGFWLSGPNYNVSNSYVKLCGSGGTHADGIQLAGTTGGNNAVFDNVTFDMSFTELGAQNSPVFWSGSSQGNNSIIKNSLMIAGGYTLRVHSGTGMTLMNNVIKRNAWQFGPTLIDPGRVSVCIGNTIANVDSNYNVTNKTSIGC